MRTRQDLLNVTIRVPRILVLYSTFSVRRLATRERMSPTFDLVVWELYICRYVIASVYIVLLLEHLASLPQAGDRVYLETEDTQKRFTAIFFPLVSLFRGCRSYHYQSYYVGYLTSFGTQRKCKQAVAVVAALSIFSMGIADALVMLRVSVLWGRQRLILGILLFSCLSTFSAAAISVVIVATKLVASTNIVPPLSICLPFHSQHQMVVGVWVPGMVFDGLVLSLAGWNACAQPRTQQTAFTLALYRDGVVVFLILAALRAVSLFFSLFGSQFYLLGLCISWPMSTITLSRFIFRVRRLEKGLALPSNSSGDTAVAGADSEWCSVPHGSFISLQARHNSLS
ncbi:hypothetical protein JB92DRAFT_772466 [Gautieria morchelliformis]|nr:hypothetical protein JB92DRAFT_772466 [Gautieria morchelliformis]